MTMYQRVSLARGQYSLYPPPATLLWMFVAANQAFTCAHTVFAPTCSADTDTRRTNFLGAVVG